MFKHSNSKYYLKPFPASWPPGIPDKGINSENIKNGIVSCKRIYIPCGLEQRMVGADQFLDVNRYVGEFVVQQTAQVEEGSRIADHGLGVVYYRTPLFRLEPVLQARTPAGHV